jgi:hypothetical protein
VRAAEEWVGRRFHRYPVGLVQCGTAGRRPFPPIRNLIPRGPHQVDISPVQALACAFRRKGPGVSVQTDHLVRAKRTEPEDGDATPIQLSEVVLSGRRSRQELLSNFVAGAVGSVGTPVGCPRPVVRLGGSREAQQRQAMDGGCDLPGRSTGRHFPQLFVEPRGRLERQRRDPGAARRQPDGHHGAGAVVTRSESATGSSQWGQGAPGPSRRQNVPHPSPRWAPR